MPSGTGGFRIFRNGVEAGPFKWSNHQLAGISLTMAAFDVQIGNGTLIVPGDPGWIAGDRISIFETSGGGSTLIYMGYVGNRQRQRNPASPLEFESIYTMMDVNRQLIGRKVVGWDWSVPSSLGTTVSRTVGFVTLYLSDLTVNVDWIDTSAPVDMAPRIYYSDGIVDLAGDTVLYSGKTTYMILGSNDNEFEFHYHALTTGPTAGLRISDVGYDGITIIAPSDPIVAWTSNDLKNEVDGTNGLVTVAGAGAPNSHNDGGLFWQQYLTYPVNEDSLVLYVNTIVTTMNEEVPTYSCTLKALTGNQLRQIPPGSIIVVTSAVFGLTNNAQRISHITLTPSAGPAVGLWDAHLELNFPSRQATAVVGYGSQGSQSGALQPATDVVTHVNTTMEDLALEVGESEPVKLWLATDQEKQVNLPDVTINIEVVTDPPGGTDYTVDDGSLITGPDGSVTTAFNHVSAGPSTRARVRGYV